VCRACIGGIAVAANGTRRSRCVKGDSRHVATHQRETFQLGRRLMMMNDDDAWRGKAWRMMAGGAGA